MGAVSALKAGGNNFLPGAQPEDEYFLQPS